MWDLWHILVEIFYPPTCAECKQKIQLGLLCPRCRRKLEDFRILQPIAYDCPDVNGICLFFRYEGGIKKSLHRIKFDGRQSLLPALAQEMEMLDHCGYLAEHWHLPQKLVVMPVPTDSRRREKRGYDIPTGIFRNWSGAEGYLWQEGLSRIKLTSPQYGLSKKERRKNVHGCFAAVLDVVGADILLVDDIFTSGATIEEAARTLRKSGAAHVWAMAFAGGADDWKNQI